MFSLTQECVVCVTVNYLFFPVIHFSSPRKMRQSQDIDDGKCTAILHSKIIDNRNVGVLSQFRSKIFHLKKTIPVTCEFAWQRDCANLCIKLAKTLR